MGALNRNCSRGGCHSTLDKWADLDLSDPGGSLLARLPALSRALLKYQVTQLSLVPTLLDRVHEPEVGLVPGVLRSVLVGGAASSRRLLTRLAPHKLPRLLVPIAAFARLRSGKIGRRSVHADLAAVNAATG